MIRSIAASMTDTGSSLERPVLFAEHVHDRRVGPCRLLTLATPVVDVVSWRGSFKAQPNFAAGDDLLQRLTVALLDRGTARRDRFAVAELLEDRGAQVSFSSDGLHVDFSGRALREDVEQVVSLVAEQLKEPLLDPEEFEKARARVAASLQRSLESTGKQAGAALSRRLYAPAHPNYSEAPEDQLQRLQDLTVDDVRRYHSEHFGTDALTLAVVGDVDGAPVEDTVRESFGAWHPRETEPSYDADARPEQPGRSAVEMPDRQNVDVRMGHPLSLLRQDDDYLPLFVANYILGGNFSARLMTVVRDEMGLTYGIRSGFTGITSDYRGHWQVAVTLSGENVERGIEAAQEQVARFAEEGVTEEELRAKKTTITGSYKVGLATSGGLAAALLHNAERGFDLSYLDHFPSLIEEMELSHVNEVVRRHLKPDAFHIALAGTLS